MNKLSSFALTVLALALLPSLAPMLAAELQPIPASSCQPEPTINSDRWLEIDLYWFDKEHMDESGNAFWDRFGPLMTNVAGWKGVILNVGWLMDSVLEWNGELDQEIRLPQNMTQTEILNDRGNYHGNTLERMAMVRDVAASSLKRTKITYEKWTYRDLKKLQETLRRIAASKYQINDLHVGILVVAWKNIYGGAPSSFSLKHSNIFITNESPFSTLFYPAKFSADSRKYGAYPKGMPEGTPFTQFFGRQWGSMSQSVGLDAIVLRDSFFGTIPYTREGPFGKTAPKDPAILTEWSQATADLVRETKQSNPKALVIGYSNGASAVGDLRVNCCDLEAIAKEGYLDAYIDQSWAGAWNEVGARGEVGPNGDWFWNNQMLGWSYQLAYILVHGAMLADTKVRHYILTETYDAWEPWDVIHYAPNRLRWGIWAYSHAAVKTPTGLKMPVGNYISWCNHGKCLLSKSDVKFLATNINNANLDAAQTKEVFGPTLVYCRSAMDWQTKHKPDESIGEWIDEQFGTVSKWSVPVLSITRSEYLDKINSDLFIYQTPVHLTPTEKSTILTNINAGLPSVVVGSPVGGLDQQIANAIGISSTATTVGPTECIASINYQTDDIYEDVPNTFPIIQPFSQSSASTKDEVIYSVKGSPCFLYNGNENKQLLYWNAPDHLERDTDEAFGLSLDQVLGSPIPFVLAARKINEMLAANNCISVEHIDTYDPVMYSAWQLNSGEYRVLAANLEEGINHTADFVRQAEVNIPRSWTTNNAIIFHQCWNDDGSVLTRNHQLPITLEQAESKLFMFNK